MAGCITSRYLRTLRRFSAANCTAAVAANCINSCLPAVHANNTFPRCFPKVGGFFVATACNPHAFNLSLLDSSFHSSPGGSIDFVPRPDGPSSPYQDGNSFHLPTMMICGSHTQQGRPGLFSSPVALVVS